MSLEIDLQKLEKIVQELASGEKTLDESLELYNDGLTLLKSCQEQIQTVEQKIKIITAENGALEEKDFVE